MVNKRYTPRKKKICMLCHDSNNINYKDTAMLRRFLSDRGKILARRVTGSCAYHQRTITLQIKIARHLALLPFVQD